MKLKKLRKAIKSIGRTAAKVVKYVAPVAGAVVLGPVGAAGGALLSGAASQVGPNKNRGAALKRALVYGGAVTAGATAVSVLGGTSLTTSSITAAGRMFAPGAAPPGANKDDPFAGQDPFLTGRVSGSQDNNGTPGSGNTLNSLANAFLGGGGPAVPGNEAGGDRARSPFGDPNLGGLGGQTGMQDTGDGGSGDGGFPFLKGRGVWLGVGVVILILVIVATAGKRRAAA